MTERMRDWKRQEEAVRVSCGMGDVPQTVQ